MVNRARLVADEVARLEHRAVGIDELALEDDELLHAGMAVLDDGGAGLHAHEIAALPRLAIEADRQPAHLRLQRTIEIVGQEFGLGNPEYAAAGC
jgi:hypothetical protein